MLRIHEQLDSAGYVDDPEFCMVRRRGDLSGPSDQRLVYYEALFIGASKFPGDDVLLAIDLSGDSTDHNVLWFDWSRMRPGRWVRVTLLSSLIEAIDAERES